MTDLINGRTTEEIITGLTCEVPCHKCAYRDHSPMKDDSCSYYVEQDIIALIEHLEAKQPRWISVEERLPWMNKKVLVTDGFIVVEAHYNGRAEWIHNGHFMETSGVIVTHWMHLPEPPKEEPNA